MARRSTFEVKPAIESIAKIKVIGVGGSGSAAMNRMLSEKIRSIEFIAVNTDAQALQQSVADVKVQIGRETTRGLGAGMDADLGMRSAEESEDEIREHISEADMVFITCGLGGGTGTGAAPVIADIARESGALTVAVVTRPFKFEGMQRRRIADEGLNKLIDKVDTIITIPNDRLLQVIDKKTTLIDAFKVVDEVLRQGVIGISELITIPGMVNVDFADVKAIMADAGSALMGIGIASGENRAAMAARAAVESPLLEVSIDGARGVLFVVTAGKGLTMHEVNEAAEVITASSDPDAKIIFGTVIDDAMDDELKVTVIATGFRNFQDKAEKAAESKRETVRAQPFAAPDQKTERNVFIKPKETPLAETEEEDELDIPAFIRNRMKK
ncbi:MAG: cell division protein FtsZ [Candidatus Komeilibacteria bacterium]|nr:cell division protein FtsZ [Candidatus Komeilibacteria bacterium]